MGVHDSGNQRPAPAFAVAGGHGVTPCTSLFLGLRDRVDDTAGLGRSRLANAAGNCGATMESSMSIATVGRNRGSWVLDSNGAKSALDKQYTLLGSPVPPFPTLVGISEIGVSPGQCPLPIGQPPKHRATEWQAVL